MPRHVTQNVLDDLMIKNPSGDLNQKLRCIESKLKREKLSVIEATKLFHTAYSTLKTGKEEFPATIKYFEHLLRHLLSDRIPIPSQSQNNVHNFVEMGDGLKWATSNIGAAKPEEFGEYIAWGETEPFYSSLNPLEFKPGKEAGYDWACTKYFPGPTKYNPQDGKKVLEPIDDAARVRWGDAWRIPTAKEWSRLLDAKNYKWEAAVRNSVQGFTVTSLVMGYEGNQIFLPIACDIVGVNLAKDGLGCYWSSESEDYNYDSSWLYAKALRFGLECPPGIRTGGRCDGFCIRPVKE